jgi:tRNA threonylcarbamoyladenosine biosynthesis protein TsaE
MPPCDLLVVNAEAMDALGRRLARPSQGLERIYFSGPLGAGKTSLARGLLHGLGHAGTVKSPTFTLVEPYVLAERRVFHFDLYRLTNINELEHIGIRDYFQPGNLCLVEWPEHGRPLLPQADLEVMISLSQTGRCVRFIAHTDKGQRALATVA